MRASGRQLDYWLGLLEIDVVIRDILGTDLTKSAHVESFIGDGALGLRRTRMVVGAVSACVTGCAIAFGWSSAEELGVTFCMNQVPACRLVKGGAVIVQSRIPTMLDSCAFHALFACRFEQDFVRCRPKSRPDHQDKDALREVFFCRTAGNSPGSMDAPTADEPRKVNQDQTLPTLEH